MLVDRDEASVGRALAAIRAVLPRYQGADGGVAFLGTAWIVTARR
jgi:hypothetical protein